MSLQYTPATVFGTPCPAFKLPRVESFSKTAANSSSPKDLFDSTNLGQFNALVVMFICSHCPYVLAIEDRIIKLAKELKTKNVPCIGICSNDSMDYPEDAPLNLYSRWQKKNFCFPYLVDETQSVAKSFGAICTPDFFVYDKEGLLFYRGRLDDSWKDETKVNHNELAEAVDSMLLNKPLPRAPIPAMGCSIKWRET